MEHATEAVRVLLNSASFAEAWEAGRSISLEEAVALALGEDEPDL